MSLKSLCQKHLVTIYLGTSSIGEDGSEVVTYAQSGNQRRCRVVESSGARNVELAQTGVVKTHNLYFTSDPGVDERYRIVHDGSEFEVLWVCNPDRLDRYWIVECKETTQRQVLTA